MREQITFAVDSNGSAHYVGVSDLMRTQLSIEEAGAAIDEWPGDFPGSLKPGFYSAVLVVSGTLDHPVLNWTDIQVMPVYPPWAKVTKVPEFKEKPRRVKKATPAEPQTLAVRVRRNGQEL